MSKRLMFFMLLVFTVAMTSVATFAVATNSSAASPLDDARAVVESARIDVEELTAEMDATQQRADVFAAQFWFHQDSTEAAELRVETLNAEIAELDTSIADLRGEVATIIVDRYMSAGDDSTVVPGADLNRQVRAEALAGFASGQRFDAIAQFEGLVSERAGAVASVEAELIEVAAQSEAAANDRAEIKAELASLSQSEAELTDRLADLEAALDALEQEELARLAAEAAEAERVRIAAERAAAEEAARVAAERLRLAPTTAPVVPTPQPTVLPAVETQAADTTPADTASDPGTAEPATGDSATDDGDAPQPAAVPTPIPAATAIPEPTATPAPTPAPVVSGSMAAGWRCPLSGSFTHVDDFLSPRAVGGWHKANDLIADTGVPVIAVIGGQLEHRGNSVGGMSAHLKGDDGNYYYYTHLSGYENEGIGYVSAGQVIGYVGESGNAPIPHLHFEIHQNGYGNYINPYPIIRNYCF